VADCIVVGGGLIGLLTARELRQAGLEVVLVERGEPGQESSWAGGGILSPLHPWRYPDAVTMLARASQARYRDLTEDLHRETGIDAEWEPSGMLVLDPGEEAVVARAWASRFHAPFEELDGAGLAAREPGLGPGWSGGMWLPEIAQVRNPRLVRALARSLDLRGVTVHSHTPALEVEVARGRVSGLRTPAATLRAGRVVVASGAWTPSVLGPHGRGLPIEPVRGQMVLFRAAPGLVRRIVLAGSRYLVPRRDGRVLAGSTIERVGFDKSTTADALRDLSDAAARLVPALRGLPVERHWAGLRPGSTTGVPTIGRHPEVDGLFVNAGHFRNGVVLAPASARLLADVILDRTPEIDPAPYRWEATCRDTAGDPLKPS
jgi:glycine oxidase